MFAPARPSGNSAMTTDRLSRSALTVQMVCGAGVAAVAGLARLALPLMSVYPARAIVAFAVSAFLAVRCVRRSHPFTRFGLANTITTLRAGLVALAAATVGETPIPGIAAYAALLIAVATLLDGADGWAARRESTSSRFGARFDIEVDAAAILVLSILVWRNGKAGSWVLASGLLRYMFVAAGVVWPWIRAPLPVSFRGKLICVLQIAALLVALWPPVGAPLSAWVAATGLGALCYSFLVDTRWLWRHRSEL
jgi:phosphatidylglycerophosphate synthase